MKYLTIRSINKFSLKIVIVLINLLQVQFADAYSFYQTGLDKGYLTGKIITENGDPIPNASVLLKGTKFGGSTNKNGVYSFNAPTGTYTLTASSVGFLYMDKEIKLVANEALEVNFILQEVTKQLPKIVVKGRYLDNEIILESKTAIKSNLSN